MAESHSIRSSGAGPFGTDTDKIRVVSLFIKYNASRLAKTSGLRVVPRAPSEHRN